MAFSRQFRALLRLSALWAIPWVALGLVVAVGRWIADPDVRSTAGPLQTWLVGHGLAYGALGVISGLYLGLLLSRLERGRQWESVGALRLGLWSGFGGAAPAILFAALGLLFGAPLVLLLPLLGLGILGAAGSVVLATSARAAGTRRALAPAADQPRVSAT